MAVPYVRTVKTASGTTVVQIVYFSRRRARDIEHIGSAYGESEAELIKAAARQRIAAGHASCTSDWTQAGRGRLAGDHLLAGGAPAGRAVPGA